MSHINLSTIVQQLLQKGKGILAADESIPTVGKRFSGINLENNEENRRAFRHMLLSNSKINQYISGVILFDETLRQMDLDNNLFVKVLKSNNIIPGIKVDCGLTPMTDGSLEQVTKGLDTLRDRLREYSSLGAKFCKWRSVITINESQNLPTMQNIIRNMSDLADYAQICQEEGMVPMVEPEILIDGTHSISTAYDVQKKVLSSLFFELSKRGIELEGTILKTSMVISGKSSGVKDEPKDVAEYTVRLFKEVLPRNLGGVAFLSGGQNDIQATQNLNAINSLSHEPLPWTCTFSYARALQDAATKVWEGKMENIPKAQEVFLHRAKMNSLASIGQYFSTDDNFNSITSSSSQN